ncbi:MAG: glycosyltransferase family 2 protein, partial [Acidimicrobiaceae bacterium]|nr:glycosyltransferase family 2 protein [Acidimicrobiaceae bacterium]
MIASPVDSAAPAPGASGTAQQHPTVLAVVVAHRPGEWFEETLESLALQDYESLSVVVVDAAGSGLGPRVAAVAEGADVIDAAGVSGFSEAANAVLSAELSADFLLVCHDDVALSSDAVSVLVAEALRSSAGVVGPKIVEWDRPEIIRHAGYDVDRFGVAADRAGAHELDQEQHDGVRDSFALPSAAMLIRTELFVRLGGFDAGMTFRGEDVDFCWRAQMAGARVMFVGGAVVRHRGGLASRTGIDDVRRTQARHALRAMLVNHGRISLTLFVPLAVLMAVAEVVLGVFTARFGRVRDVVSAWVWNISRLDVVLERRRANTQV